MKIIQVLNSPNWSAASAYCINVSYELMKLGHEVLIMTEPGKPLEQAKSLGIPCDDKLRLNEHSLSAYVHGLKHLKQTYKRFKPDIVSAHMNECSWMPGFVAKMSFPTAKVVRVRADIAAPNKNIFNLYVNHKWTDHIICSSQLHKDVCCKNLFLSPDKLSVVYGSVDAEKFNTSAYDSSIRKQLGLLDDDFVVCLLGRLSPVKGHEYAIKAVSLLKDLPVKVKLLCIGYESERKYDWLNGEAERLGVTDRLVTVERCDNIPAVLNSVDVGIITSLGSEANSRATLEYMACGKPVVVTNVGVLPELVVEGKNGFVIEKGNSEKLAEALKKLVLNRNLCLEMGTASRQRIEDNFTLKQFGLKMEAVYKIIIDKKSLCFTKCTV